MTAVALIPARGGSTRVADKNIRPLDGHPLLAYTVAAARQAGVFEEVVVSTDSPRYAEVAEHYGARALERPAELASHTADLVGTTEHALDDWAARGTAPDVLCLLMPCCPLRRSAQVRAHISAFAEAGRSFQLSVVDYAASHPHWALARDEEGHIDAFFGWEHFKRSQELQKVYCPSGAIWIVSVVAFREQRAFYGKPLHGEPLPFPDGMDIDEPEDLELAAALVDGFRAQGRELLEPIEASPWSPAA
jgi:CMP-N-acetylneuraminic acid synthetase